MNTEKRFAPRWFIRLEQAISTAQSEANKYGLPQTVFQNLDTCGWANTNPFSSVLGNSEVFATMLPANYFAK